MTKKSLVYLFPSNLNHHEGLHIKAKGQLNALSTSFNTTLYSFNGTKNPFTLPYTLLFFYIKSIFLAFTHDIIYYRYNPKMILLSWFLAQLSHKKTVFIEYNGIYTTELTFLNRHIENWLHQISITLIKHHPQLHHIGANDSITDYLRNKGLKHCITIQNGYMTPKTTSKNTDQNVIKKVQCLKEKHTKIGVFIGQGYSWHGTDKIIALLANTPQIHLLIIGNYNTTKNTEHYTYLGKLNTTTISELFSLCDFGIGSFNWQQVGITHGAPLKTRQYLCHGLPILVNYHDHASDITTLKPYVFNLKNDTNALTKLLTTNTNKTTLKTIAQKELSWENLLLPYILNITNPPKKPK